MFDFYLHVSACIKLVYCLRNHFFLIEILAWICYSSRILLFFLPDSTHQYNSLSFPLMLYFHLFVSSHKQFGFCLINYEYFLGVFFPGLILPLLVAWFFRSSRLPVFFLWLLVSDSLLVLSKTLSILVASPFPCLDLLHDSTLLTYHVLLTSALKTPYHSLRLQS